MIRNVSVRENKPPQNKSKCLPLIATHSTMEMSWVISKQECSITEGENESKKKKEYILMEIPSRENTEG